MFRFFLLLIAFCFSSALNAQEKMIDFNDKSIVFNGFFNATTPKIAFFGKDDEITLVSPQDITIKNFAPGQAFAILDQQEVILYKKPTVLTVVYEGTREYGVLNLSGELGDFKIYPKRYSELSKIIVGDSVLSDVIEFGIFPTFEENAYKVLSLLFKITGHGVFSVVSIAILLAIMLNIITDKFMYNKNDDERRNTLKSGFSFLIEILIMISFYGASRIFTEPTGESFLWVNDITKPDATSVFGTDPFFLLDFSFLALIVALTCVARLIMTAKGLKGYITAITITWIIGLIFTPISVTGLLFIGSFRIASQAMKYVYMNERNVNNTV